MTHKVVLTVDLDRDYPIESMGKMSAHSAVSQDTDLDPEIRGTMAGTSLVLDYLSKLKIPCIFFIEASVLKKMGETELVERLLPYEIGSHGVSHEDFTGELSGYIPTSDEITTTLKTSIQIISKFLKTPRGFRAPFLNVDSRVMKRVENLFEYDSSVTIKQIQSYSNVSIDKEFDWINIPELFLSTTNDKRDKPISGYLWQLFEGSRTEEDYLFMLDRCFRINKLTYTTLAFHPWHLSINTKERRYLTKQEVHNNFRKLYNLLDKVQSSFEFVGVEDILSL